MASMAAPLRKPRSYVGQDSTIASLENDFYNPAKAIRRQFEPQWLLNVAFTLGKQWVSVDGLGMLNSVDSEDRVTLTDNRIRGIVRSSIAKQTKNDPMWSGVPADSSDDEIVRARMREVIFEHYWRELEWRRRLRMWLWWKEVTGAGFVKQWWDHTAGETITVIARDGVVVLDAFGGPVTPDRVRHALSEDQREGLVEQRLTFGDVKAELVPPFSLVVDPLATSEGLTTAEYVVQDSILSPATIRRLYPKYGGELVEDAVPYGGALEARFPGLTRYLDHERGAAGRRGCKVRELWSLPGVGGPRGKHAVYTPNGELLLEEDNPYPFLCYSMMGADPSGRFWPDAPVNDYISPQTELNKTKSQIADNAERFGNPARLQSFESLGANDDLRWAGLPGEEILYQDRTGVG
jgi:hypothetical protein